MPELPDVECFRRYFEAVALGKRVEGVEVRNQRILDGVPATEFAAKVTGKTFRSTVRIGKNLLVELEAGLWLTLHFGMTGFLKFFTKPEDDPGHVRVLFTLPDGLLAYDNRRMIGKVGLTGSPDDLVRDKKLGPDALEVDAGAFCRGVLERKGEIKSVLMDQSFIAGVGNVYADEILFQMKLDPRTPAAALDKKIVREMFEKMSFVLKTAVDRDAEVEKLPDSFQLPHRAGKGKCPRCDVLFETVKIGGRTTYFCRNCQRLPF